MGNSLDVLARMHLWKEQKNYNHGTGHGVGSFLNVHEGPVHIGTTREVCNSYIIIMIIHYNYVHILHKLIH